MGRSCSYISYLARRASLGTQRDESTLCQIDFDKNFPLSWVVDVSSYSYEKVSNSDGDLSFVIF